MKVPRFTLGLLLGGSFGVLFWYWQKSTSAEEGALAVLDRLAVAEARVRNLESQIRNSRSTSGGESSETPTQDLQLIDGIGPTYAQRFNDAGVTNFEALAALSPDQVREIVGLRDWQAFRAEDWIDAARIMATQ